ncbi:hypothetical protein AAG570_012609 [Ranatra chinensis]|uniref:Gustatory receptor n=1 Tax=Ranatra chinensis TaxID=642074 RepID=A0ABD0YGA8_9HEMI
MVSRNFPHSNKYWLHLESLYNFLLILFIIRVKVHNGAEKGNIYSPLLILSYGELTREDFERNMPIKISFAVDFYMNTSVKRTFDVVLGVFCGVAAIWSLIRCWCHVYRSGQRTIDIITLVNLVIISCGHLANVFFFVTACSAIHSLIYYKGQIVAYVLLPSPELIYLVETYVITAFPLKVCEVLAMIWHQITVDIFLIDWEQPRVKSNIKHSVSAWRTYFVANEWNEIQTMRKTSIVFQLAVTIMILKVYGVENWANSTPELHSPGKNDSYNVVFRFAIGVMVYCLVYVIQLLIMVGFYQRYIKNRIQEFVDVCSLANISVFILSLPNFGYYIHGRSAHGFADADMGTLRNQLYREAEDLVGHRGLVSGTDHQTFQLLIPSRLRCVYTSLLSEVCEFLGNLPQTIWRKPTGKSGVQHIDHIMNSYISLNRFLAGFIEHALKDLDYEVKDKTVFESLLDIECYDFKNSGVLYYDNGHSFDNVLYHGNEATLFFFDVILFSFLEIMTHNFILAAVITGFCSEFISCVRRIAGRKNLAKKTLIDEHFLI